MEVSNHTTQCKHCEKKFIRTNLRQVYCHKSCKQRNTYSYQKDRAEKRKKILVEKSGGRCKKCGYNKNYSALSFHHIDPSVKEFSLDARSLSNRTEERIAKEFAKCELLCLNCHAELHNPQCLL